MENFGVALKDIQLWIVKIRFSHLQVLLLLKNFDDRVAGLGAQFIRLEDSPTSQCGSSPEQQTGVVRR